MKFLFQHVLYAFCLLVYCCCQTAVAMEKLLTPEQWVERPSDEHREPSASASGGTAVSPPPLVSPSAIDESFKFTSLNGIDGRNAPHTEPNGIEFGQQWAGHHESGQPGVERYRLGNRFAYTVPGTDIYTGTETQREKEIVKEKAAERFTGDASHAHGILPAAHAAVHTKAVGNLYAYMKHNLGYGPDVANAAVEDYINRVTNPEGHEAATQKYIDETLYPLTGEGRTDEERKTDPASYVGYGRDLIAPMYLDDVNRVIARENEASTAAGQHAGLRGSPPSTPEHLHDTLGHEVLENYFK